jgi:hypothetical protein
MEGVLLGGVTLGDPGKATACPSKNTDWNGSYQGVAWHPGINNLTITGVALGVNNQQETIKKSEKLPPVSLVQADCLRLP